MTDIAQLIQDLQIPDLEQRYSACKSLQEQAQLPPEAVQALQEASQDPEPLISCAANRALQRHEPHPADPYSLDEPYLGFREPVCPLEIIESLVLFTVIALLTVPLMRIMVDERLNDLWFLSLPAMFLAGFAAYLTYQVYKPRHLIAALSSIAVGLLSGILSFLLLSSLLSMASAAYRGY
jgi:hypothetical protein